MRNMVLVLALCLCLCMLAQRASCTWKGEGQPLEYFILEELPGVNPMGNVAIDYKLTEKFNTSILQAMAFSIKEAESVRWDLFKLEAGIVSTVAKIDRDAVCPGEDVCLAWLRICVTPLGLTEDISIKLEILDINDNKPVFVNKTLTLSVPESAALGTVFSLPTATDRDAGRNGVSSYELIPESEFFTLEVKDGVLADGTKHQELSLKLVGRLDRELGAFHTLTLIAHDGGSTSFSGSLLVNVTVSDVNDHDPRFDNATYKANIRENRPNGTVVVRVRAHDFDLGNNALVTYAFDDWTELQHGDLFRLDEHTGVITTLKQFDFETGSTYLLIVQAWDAGADARVPGEASVVVRVVDENDNTPVITLSANTLTPSGEVSVQEDADVGVDIARLSVSDLDGGDNGRVVCELRAPAAFALRKVHWGHFRVTTAQELDRETREEYILTVTCHDQGAIPNFASQDVVVRVMDVNDNAPKYSNAIYTVHMPAEQAPNQAFLVVRATDPDAGNAGQIRYSVHENAADRFKVDPISGEVSLRTRINLDASNIRFRVVAVDLGNPPRSSTATVRISQGSAEPDFTQSNYEFGVYENFPTNTEIGVVSLRNAIPGEFDFSFVQESGEDFSHRFGIGTQTGIITTKALFDREKRTAYYLTVRVARHYQPRSTSTVSVTVYIADKNDNGPVLLYPTESNHTAFISAAATIGTRVATIHAHDADLAGNGKLTYTITSGNGDDAFRLNPTTGVLTMVRDIRRSQSSAYTLDIRVSDGGSPRFMTTARLNVFINRTLLSAAGPEVGVVRQDVVDSSYATMVVAVTAACLITVFLILFGVMIYLLWRRMQPLSGRGLHPCPGNKYCYSNMEAPPVPATITPTGGGGGGGVGVGVGAGAGGDVSASSTAHAQFESGRGKNMSLLVGACPSQQPQPAGRLEGRSSEHLNTDVCLRIDCEKPQRPYVENNMFVQGSCSQNNLSGHCPADSRCYTQHQLPASSTIIQEVFDEDGGMDSDESFVRTCRDSYAN